jgi:hypothetical protein
VFYWASGAGSIEVPYLHGFLNFPMFLYGAFFLAIIASFFGWTRLFFLPALFLTVEIAYSLRCLRSAIDYTLPRRIIASCYVLASDLLTPLCALQYLISGYKRPYSRLGIRRAWALVLIFLHWELSKIGLHWRSTSTLSEKPRPSSMLEVALGDQENSNIEQKA